MKLVPLFDKIVVQPVESEETTASGLYLPTSAQEKPQTAKVIAVGEGGIIDGKEIKMVVSVDDVILYSKYAGNEYKIDGQTYVIIRQSDVLAKVL
ncbi:MAG: co-chaperone GroES [Clostridia bacterium]|nr:co-chaperone GroES [Clostridia bacterium]